LPEPGLGIELAAQLIKINLTLLLKLGYRIFMVFLHFFSHNIPPLYGSAFSIR
jgi:hypothetical protein